MRPSAIMRRMASRSCSGFAWLPVPAVSCTEETGDSGDSGDLGKLQHGSDNGVH